MSSIPWLEVGADEFPPVESALQDPNGLLAAGGDLTQARLISAYRQGIFPWFDDDQPILWWTPDPRCVLFLDELHISRSLKKSLRKADYQVSLDRCFESVVTHCSGPRSRSSGTWITEQMRQAYGDLHYSGLAHSVEVWDESGGLVGGLYGLAMGGLFFGESMFSHRPDASKIAFVHLVEQLRSWGYYLIDCQVYSEHLASLGACEIPRTEFSRILNNEVDRHVQHPWRMDWCYRESSS